MATGIALLVIDFSTAFTNPDSELYCPADSALDATATLLSAAREAGALVVYTTVAYDESGALAARRFIEKNPSAAVLKAGSPDVEIDDRVAPEPGEPVLTKLVASGFFNTPLASLLTASHIETVMIVGASTSGCVRATAVDAIQHGYKVYVPRDAVADRSGDAHRQSLLDIQSRYGEVVDLPEALALLKNAETVQTTDPIVRSPNV